MDIAEKEIKTILDKLGLSVSQLEALSLQNSNEINILLTKILPNYNEILVEREESFFHLLTAYSFLISGKSLSLLDNNINKSECTKEAIKICEKLELNNIRVLTKQIAIYSDVLSRMLFQLTFCRTATKLVMNSMRSNSEIENIIESINRINKSVMF